MTSITRQFSEALARLNSGDLDAASAECDVLRRAAPNDPAVLQLHATILLRAGRPADAHHSIRQSLALRPGHVPSLILAARAARAQGASDQAVASLRDAVARAPDAPEPAFLLCEILLDLCDPLLESALTWAAARHGACATKWQELGWALHRAARPGAALAAFTRATAADPTLVAAHFGCGLLLRHAGRMAEAHAALTRAVTFDPKASGAWFTLGLTCQDLGDESAAAVAFGAALRERPDFAEAAVNLGIAVQRLGDMDAALAAYCQALRIRPDTFGRIAQAMTSASTGILVLDRDGLRRMLGA